MPDDQSTDGAQPFLYRDAGNRWWLVDAAAQTAELRLDPSVPADDASAMARYGIGYRPVPLPAGFDPDAEIALPDPAPGGGNVQGMRDDQDRIWAIENGIAHLRWDPARIKDGQASPDVVGVGVAPVPLTEARAAEDPDAGDLDDDAPELPDPDAWVGPEPVYTTGLGGGKKDPDRHKKLRANIGKTLVIGGTIALAVFGGPPGLLAAGIVAATTATVYFLQEGVTALRNWNEKRQKAKKEPARPEKTERTKEEREVAAREHAVDTPDDAKTAEMPPVSPAEPKAAERKTGAPAKPAAADTLSRVAGREDVQQEVDALVQGRAAYSAPEVDRRAGVAAGERPSGVRTASEADIYGAVLDAVAGGRLSEAEARVFARNAVLRYYDKGERTPELEARREQLKQITEAADREAMISIARTEPARVVAKERVSEEVRREAAHPDIVATLDEYSRGPLDRRSGRSAESPAQQEARTYGALLHGIADGRHSPAETARLAQAAVTRFDGVTGRLPSTEARRSALEQIARTEDPALQRAAAQRVAGTAQHSL